MRAEITLEQDGRLLDRYEFDPRKADMVSSFATAMARFRRGHPDFSLTDAGVSITLKKAPDPKRT